MLCRRRGVQCICVGWDRNSDFDSVTFFVPNLRSWRIEKRIHKTFRFQPMSGLKTYEVGENKVLTCSKYVETMKLPITNSRTLPGLSRMFG